MSRHIEMPSALSANRSHLANLSAPCLQGDGAKIEPLLSVSPTGNRTGKLS
jgi:hypothetical protein